MMENKYYVPDISEFHVGFEFETRQHVINTSWQKIVAEWEDLEIVFDDFEHDENYKSIYRVKYLDKEDIESLGWKRDKLRSDQLSNQIFQKGNWVLYLRIENNELYPIDLFCKDRSYKFININNKSELKKLMKQLRID